MFLPQSGERTLKVYLSVFKDTKSANLSIVKICRKFLNWQKVRYINSTFTSFKNFSSNIAAIRFTTVRRISRSTGKLGS